MHFGGVTWMIFVICQHYCSWRDRENNTVQWHISNLTTTGTAESGKLCILSQKTQWAFHTWNFKLFLLSWLISKREKKEPRRVREQQNCTRSLLWKHQGYICTTCKILNCTHPLSMYVISCVCAFCNPLPSSLPRLQCAILHKNTDPASFLNQKHREKKSRETSQSALCLHCILQSRQLSCRDGYLKH